ncbi:MAG: helix-turn-helix domain-containing protein [Alphaproteobacteria bacterium]|uniref:helix-turn-helix domain-containing protein n=2 Tax=Pseudomonadota TaxID=1224 RepID=UPI0032690AA0
MSSSVRLEKRQPFSVVPDYILEDKRMRPETRLVLAWLIGRPTDWKIQLRYMMFRLGLSRDRWNRARREMQKCGYLTQTRHRKPDGSFEWEHVVTDTPSDATIAGFPSSGDPEDGKPGNITTPSHQQDSNTPLNPPVAITQACFEEAQRRFGGYSVEHLEERWRAWVNDKGEVPKHCDKAFLTWAATYVRNHPLPGGGTF